MRHTTERLPRAWRTKKRVWLYLGWQFFVPQYLKSPAFPVAQVNCIWVQRVTLPALVCREPQWSGPGPGQVMTLLLMSHESFEGAEQVLACWILVRAQRYTSQSWRNLWFSGKKGKMAVALDFGFYVDVSYLCRCQAALLGWAPLTPPSGQSHGLLVAHLCVLLVASPEGEIKNGVLRWQALSCGFLLYPK